MKKAIYFSFVAILILMGCSKSDDLAVNSNENQLKSGRTATPISTSANPNWDNNDVLQTSLWNPLVSRHN
jgi:hypothetical protein